jgi:hypothetical protein
MSLKTAGIAGLSAAAALLASAAAATLVQSEPSNAGPQAAESHASPRATEMTEEIVRAIDASRPGPEQQWLAPLVGSWKMDLTSYSPTQAPLSLKGTSENRWVLGGRFLLSETAAGDGAARVEGMTVFGYDIRERRFFALGLNNVGTGYNQWSGTYNPRDRSLILSGKQRNELTGAASVSRQQLKIEGPARYSLRMFVDRPGRPPMRVAEATFTRP